MFRYAIGVFGRIAGDLCELPLLGWCNLKQQVLQRVIPKNPKYEGIRPVVDSGSTVSKVEQISTLVPLCCLTPSVCLCAHGRELTVAVPISNCFRQVPRSF
jgi:hypothetical protein